MFIALYSVWVVIMFLSYYIYKRVLLNYVCVSALFFPPMLEKISDNPSPPFFDLIVIILGCEMKNKKKRDSVPFLHYSFFWDLLKSIFINELYLYLYLYLITNMNENMNKMVVVVGYEKGKYH